MLAAHSDILKDGVIVVLIPIQCDQVLQQDLLYHREIRNKPVKLICPGHSVPFQSKVEAVMLLTQNSAGCALA